MISGRVLGSQQVKAKIAKARAEIPTLLSRQQLGAFLVRRMREHFDKERDHTGKAWAKRSPKTRPEGKILNKEGNLYKSVDVVDGNPNGIFASATGAGLRIGIKSIKTRETFKNGNSRTVDTNVYGRVHQLGNGHVPQRRFIGIGAADKKAIGDLLRREMKKALRV